MKVEPQYFNIEKHIFLGSHPTTVFSHSINGQTQILTLINAVIGSEMSACFAPLMAALTVRFVHL